MSSDEESYELQSLFSGSKTDEKQSIYISPNSELANRTDEESYELPSSLCSGSETDEKQNICNSPNAELANRILTNTIEYTSFNLESQHISVLPFIFKSEFKNEENQEPGLDNFLSFLNTIHNKLQFINNKDKYGCTALHYTGKYGYDKYFFKLLDMGAYLGIKDNQNKSPMSLVEREKLEKYFDNCIKPISESNSYQKSLDYRNLVVVDYQESFVSEETQESDFVVSILNDDKLDYLLNHPIVDIYLRVKWDQMYLYFYIYFLLNFVVYILIIVYVFQFKNHNTGSKSLLVFALCLYIIDTVISLCAYNDRFHSYLKEYRYEKIVSSVLMLLLTSILFSVLYKDKMNDFLKVVIPIVVLLSTYKLFCVLQLHYRTHLFVKILHQITRMFIMLMLLYIFPVILAFSCCFHLLADGQLDGNFSSITFSTTLGFSGHIDYNFVEFKTNKFFGNLFFVLFLFVLPIILHNLLIGFFSHEISKMRENESICKQKALAVYVTTVENMYKANYSPTGNFKYLLKLLKSVKKCEVKKLFNTESSLKAWVREKAETTMKYMSRALDFLKTLLKLPEYLKKLNIKNLFNTKSSLTIYVCPKDISKAGIVEIDTKLVKLPTMHVEKTFKNHENNRKNALEVILDQLSTL